MEPPTPTFMRAATPSYDPQSSRKRTSSPDASTTRTKRSKTDPGQGHSDKDKKRRRRRKQKKQPIARDSGTHSLKVVSGDAQNAPSSSPTPASPLPSASRSTESQLSPASSQSDRPSDSSSGPRPLHSSLGSSPHEQRTACAPLQRERVLPASPSESKVRLLSVSVLTVYELMIVSPRPQITPCEPCVISCVPNLSRFAPQTLCAFPMRACLLLRLSRQLVQR